MDGLMVWLAMYVFRKVFGGSRDTAPVPQAGLAMSGSNGVEAPLIGELPYRDTVATRLEARVRELTRERDALKQRNETLERELNETRQEYDRLQNKLDANLLGKAAFLGACAMLIYIVYTIGGGNGISLDRIPTPQSTSALSEVAIVDAGAYDAFGLPVAGTLHVEYPEAYAIVTDTLTASWRRAIAEQQARACLLTRPVSHAARRVTEVAAFPKAFALSRGFVHLHPSLHY